MRQRSEIHFPSSGDAEKDAETARQIDIHEDRMERNICPNGCGPMVLSDAHNRDCPKCGFHQWCNTPIETPAQA